MPMEDVYLLPNVVMEPLVDKWYAWSHLISPATASMNIVGRHLKIMNSYVQAPHIHAAAVKSPKMKGGPFIDLGGKRVDEIRTLIDNTKTKSEKLIAFANAIVELEVLLKTKGKGYTLEPLYAEVPDLLKGYVELVYDLNGTPSYRFFEPLLYLSEFYDESLQSIALWITNNDERPFVLSTPRLPNDHIVELALPFSSTAIDALSKMKREPFSFRRICEMLNVPQDKEALFRTFFTTNPPPVYQNYDGDRIRMRYFGHACVLLETKDVSILIDPLISYYGYQTSVNHFSDVDLPDSINYALISHNHQDHILFETLLPLRHKIEKLIVPRTCTGALQDPNVELMFRNIGFDNVRDIGEMERISFKDCTLTGIPFIGEHSDLNILSKMCYLIRVGDFKILFLADSCNVEQRLYQHIQKAVGDVDVMFLGMECDGAPMTWLYGPLLTEELHRDKDNSRRLAGSNYERGKSLVDIFSPKEVYVYAMGQEPWVEFISSIKYRDDSNPIVASNKLIEYCKTKGITAERLYGEKELLYEKHKVVGEIVVN